MQNQEITFGIVQLVTFGSSVCYLYVDKSATIKCIIS